PCLHASMPPCLHASMPPCLHASMPPCLHASMPPCLHASSVAQTRRGFTLSELLISLAVLGLISALTLPSIFNSVSQSQHKAKMKETIQVLQDVMYTGYMNGEI
ncbi:MAG: type II secretion system protein, partial [Vampirovibrionales bacterium]